MNLMRNQLVFKGFLNMIKYMTVERIDRTKSKNGERIFNLPFSIQTFENFKNFKLPEYKKLIIYQMSSQNIFHHHLRLPPMRPIIFLL